MRILVKRRIIMGFFTFLAYCLGAPVYVLSVSRRDGETVFRRIVSPSTPIVFGYIHSVERTPVEDELRAAGGRFWQWEVRVRSHNAGLPSEPGLRFSGRRVHGFPGRTSLIPDDEVPRRKRRRSGKYPSDSRRKMAFA